MPILMNAGVERRMRGWLVGALVGSANWRRAKAEEYRDDERNPNSATALLDAARYVGDRTTQGAGIYRMTQLVAACTEIEYELITEPSEYPGPKSERVASRYGFQTDFPSFADETHNQLLLDIFGAALEDLRDELEEDIPPESGLAELIAEHLPALPVSPEKTTIALLTEIRDLLRDRLPVEAEA
jgi:hypothetical protein